MDEVAVLQAAHVGADDFRVIGDHGAVVVVVAEVFVGGVGHARVKNRPDSGVHQRLHVPVHQLRREADRVGGDGALPPDVKLPGGKRRNDHLEPQPGEERVPERQQLVHVQAHGDADFPARPRLRPVRAEQLQLVGVHVQLAFAGALGDRLFAPVAADEAAVAAEHVHGQPAVVAAHAAGGDPDLVPEVLQLFFPDDGAFAGGFFHGVDRRAVGAHQAGDVGPGDLDPHLLLEHAQHGVVQKRAALHHDVSAQRLGVRHADHLVDGVFHHADRKAGADVLRRGAVLLRLLDLRVHEHRAARPQVDGVLGEQAHPGELRDAVAERAGEGLQKRAAARGTRLVQEDVVNRPVADFEALHVLPADVDYEIHVRAEALGGGEVRHRLHNAEIHVERVFQQLFPIAGHGAALYGDAGVPAVQVQQIVPENGDGVAGIAPVDGAENFAFFADEHGLHGGGPGVDAEERAAPVRGDVAARGLALRVPAAEFVVFRPAGKQRRDGEKAAGAAVFPHVFQRLAEVHFFGAAVRRAERHVIERVFGADALNFEGVVEACAQLRQKSQRAAQVKDFSFDGAALCKARDGLVGHRGEDAGADVGLAGALVQQGLHVGFCKHAAPGGDGVDLLVLCGEAVHLVQRDVQQSCHLVDEGARAAGAGAVHAHLHPAGKEQDFGVFAPQLNHGVRPRKQAAHRDVRGVDFLHERQAAGLGNPHSRRAGNGQRGRFSPHHVPPDLCQKLRHLFRDFRQVALVGLEQNLAAFIYHNTFYGSGTDVQANLHFRTCQSFRLIT